MVGGYAAIQLLHLACAIACQFSLQALQPENYCIFLRGGNRRTDEALTRTATAEVGQPSTGKGKNISCSLNKQLD